MSLIAETLKHTNMNQRNRIRARHMRYQKMEEEKRQETEQISGETSELLSNLGEGVADVAIDVLAGVIGAIISGGDG
jgi:hypothetical protein